MWKYDKPEAHPEPTWEWNIRNEFIGGYYAKYISFEADEYDYFLVGWKSTKSTFGYGCSISGCMGEAGFVDQAGFDQFVDAMNPSVSGDIFKGLTQAFRPTHNDTWYFIWVNSDDDDAYYNITVRCTENYYGFPPEPEPEPEPIPKPEPEPNDVIIPAIIGFGVLGLIGVVGIGVFFRIKKVRNFTS